MAFDLDIRRLGPPRNGPHIFSVRDKIRRTGLERFTRVDSDTSSAATAVTSAASTSAVSSSTYAQLPASDKTTWLEDPAAWDHFCSVLTSIYALLLLYLRWWLSYRKNLRPMSGSLKRYFTLICMEQA
uniref:Uncharacterized protein n=1 Tax=Ditylenchus dipsaci TaxID=166011 RepID=A0A915DWV6_9BILA